MNRSNIPYYPISDVNYTNTQYVGVNEVNSYTVPVSYNHQYVGYPYVLYGQASTLAPQLSFPMQGPVGVLPLGYAEPVSPTSPSHILPATYASQPPHLYCYPSYPGGAEALLPQPQCNVSNNMFEMQQINNPISHKNEDLVDDMLNVQQKRCTKCSRFYKESEKSVCRYHPGSYKNVYASKLAAGRFSTWSCCGENKREAAGCKIGEHVEDKNTTANLQRYHKMLQHIQPTSSSVTSQTESTTTNLIDLNFELPRSSQDKIAKASVKLELDNLLKTEGENYIKHHVKMTDTVAGLSLKYNVPAEEIMKINKIKTSQELWTRPFVKIPSNGQPQIELSDEEKAKMQIELCKRLVKRFKRITQCKTEQEALYYLDSNDFNFNNAVQEYNADMQFEREHTFKPRSMLVK